MAHDSAQTRARFLDAAFAEFVEHGLAGARVDRIAAAAGANKQAIYAYFGSKEALFDAVLRQRHADLLDAVPLTPDDLPGYAGALYDYLSAHPEFSRLDMWKRLERADASDDEIAAYRAKLGPIERALDLGTTPYSAIDVLLLVLAAANTWETTAPSIRALDPHARTPGQRRQRERAILVATVTASIQALTREPRTASPTR
jgi:AcrR family transcriptional regulator